MAVRYAILVFVVMTMPAAAQTQGRPSCAFLCAPELKIEPTFTTEHLAQRHRVETHGAVERVGRERTFELIFALDVPTTIPRIGLTLEGIFFPGADDNSPEIESELNLTLFDEDQTGGWVSSHFDVVDKFSPRETPRANSVYTHKLNFEWDTAFHVFNRAQRAPWLRHVEVELSLDYVATGLPKAGDVIGDERFLDRASPWSLSLVFVFPLIPLNP